MLHVSLIEIVHVRPRIQMYNTISVFLRAKYLQNAGKNELLQVKNLKHLNIFAFCKWQIELSNIAGVQER